MITIEHLTFTYPGAENPTLNDVTLQVEKGDFLAVIGNNGCGKSTLCKTLNGLIPHFITGDFQGSVTIDGMDTRRYDVGKLSLKAGYVYQDFENQILRPTVLDDASFACLNYAMENYEEKGRAALSMCGLTNKEKSYVWQLSGGQKHLLALAGMTALCPEVLILDEPIAQLDPAHAKQIYDVLRDLNETYGKTIIVIEHHTEYIAEYCKHAVLMKNGSLLWKLPAKEALRRVEELEESNIFPPQVTVAARLLKNAGQLPQDLILPTTLEEGKMIFREYVLPDLAFHKNYHEKLCSNNLTSFYDFIPSNSFNASNDFERDSIDLDILNKFNANHISETNSEANIQFQSTSVEYRVVKGASAKILNNFSLSIHRGEKVALIGSNGAGKSTLMKLMIGLLKPSSGKVLIQGQPTTDIPQEELSQMLSLVYQNPEEMFLKDSIRSDILYAMKERQVENYEERAEELLALFHLTELAHRDGRLLSGGQMRRASLAIGVALNPSILLLDEPTANLDIATRREIMKTLNQLKDITETVIIATHDMQLVCDWADRIIVLSQGKLIADGDRNSIFSNQYVMETVGIRPPDIYVLGEELSLSSKTFTIHDFITALGKEKLEYACKVV